MEVIFLPRDPVSNYDRMELEADLKLAGFEDKIAEIIVRRVDEKKEKGWTFEMGRQEAIRQAEELLNKSHNTLDNFRAATLSTTGQQRYGYARRPLAEVISDGVQ